MQLKFHRENLWVYYSQFEYIIEKNTLIDFHVGLWWVILVMWYLVGNGIYEEIVPTLFSKVTLGNNNGFVLSMYVWWIMTYV